MSHQQDFPADWPPFELRSWGFVESGSLARATPIPNPRCPVPICPLALHKLVRAAMWLARAPMHLRSGCIAGLAASLWRSA